MESTLRLRKRIRSRREADGYTYRYRYGPRAQSGRIDPAVERLPHRRPDLSIDLAETGAGQALGGSRLGHPDSHGR